MSDQDVIDATLRSIVDDVGCRLIEAGASPADYGIAVIGSGVAALLVERGPSEVARLLRDTADHLERKAN